MKAFFSYDDVTFFIGGNAAHYAPWWNESEIRTITEKKRDMYKTNLRSMFKYLTGLAPVRGCKSLFLCIEKPVTFSECHIHLCSQL